ncbi:hypothetical protein B0H11DRAFT_163152 [Mycena galericulata]|nr:hypothetical protein B0H11DRAFT_163152 [Mycena galericulata]
MLCLRTLQERLAKRETLSCNDFSTSRLDPHEPAFVGDSAALISAGDECFRTRSSRARRTPQKFVEEAFLDVFFDLLWGGGCGRPRAGACEGMLADTGRMEVALGRCAAQWSDVRAVLGVCAAQVPTRASRRWKQWLPSFFSHAAPSGAKLWKREPTLNGRPYVLDATPFITRSGRELHSLTACCACGGGTSHELGGVPKRGVSTSPLNAELAPSNTDAAAAGVRDGADVDRWHTRLECLVADDGACGATPVRRELSAARRGMFP